MSLTQYISATGLRHKDGNQVLLWLESGGLTLGPIDAEAAMALPNPDYHEIQDMFLKCHDKKTKRLWFLWPSENSKISAAVIGKCGCHGGCKFFGNNKNGIGFFNPRRTKDMPFAAMLQLSPEGYDLGFGQSLLCRDKLVFDMSPTNGKLSPSCGQGFVFTRGYMSDMASPDSPAAHVNIVDDVSFSQTGSTVTDKQSTGGHSLSGTLKSNISNQTNVSRTSEPKTVSTPSDVYPMVVQSHKSPSTDSFSTLSRKGSLDETMLGKSDSTVSPDSTTGAKLSPSPSNFRKSEPVSGMARSPQLLRNSFGPKAYSAVSLESEMYYSAEEDNSSNKDRSSLVFDDSLDTDRDDRHFGMNESLDRSDMDRTSRALTMDNTVNQTVISVDNTVINKYPDSDGSTVSYESAPSDQSDTDTLSIPDIPDNLSLVDLHSQINKPITNSPVLLNCYSRHLTNVQCHDWSLPSPNHPLRNQGFKTDQSVYSLSSVGQSVQYVHSPACVPHFIKLRQGFHTCQMRTVDQEILNTGNFSSAQNGAKEKEDEEKEDTAKPG